MPIQRACGAFIADKAIVFFDIERWAAGCAIFGHLLRSVGVRPDEPSRNFEMRRSRVRKRTHRIRSRCLPPDAPLRLRDT